MLDHLHRLPVRAGDGILVPAGQPHAIGAGVFVVEAQEPTDFSILLEWSVTTATREESHLGPRLRHRHGSGEPPRARTRGPRGAAPTPAGGARVGLAPALPSGAGRPLLPARRARAALGGRSRESRPATAYSSCCPVTASSCPRTARPRSAEAMSMPCRQPSATGSCGVRCGRSWLAPAPIPSSWEAGDERHGRARRRFDVRQGSAGRARRRDRCRPPPDAVAEPAAWPCGDHGGGAVRHGGRGALRARHPRHPGDRHRRLGDGRGRCPARRGRPGHLLDRGLVRPTRRRRRGRHAGGPARGVRRTHRPPARSAGDLHQAVAPQPARRPGAPRTTVAQRARAGRPGGSAAPASRRCRCRVAPVCSTRTPGWSGHGRSRPWARRPTWFRR